MGDPSELPHTLRGVAHPAIRVISVKQRKANLELALLRETMQTYVTTSGMHSAPRARRIHSVSVEANVAAPRLRLRVQAAKTCSLQALGCTLVCNRRSGASAEKAG